MLAAAVCAAGALAGGCAKNDQGRYFQPDDDAAALKNVIAAEFPRGMEREQARARAKELDLYPDRAGWAREGDVGAYWPVPRYAPSCSGTGPMRWASDADARELSGEGSDFFEIVDDRPQDVSWNVTCVLRNVPARGMVVWYDGAGRVDGVLVGPLVASMSDAFEGPGFWVHERQGGRKW